MPIFDDPKKSLERMQRQLLQDEDEYDEYDEYEEEFLTEEEWLDDEIAEAKAMLGMYGKDEDEEIFRNYANSYGKFQQARRYDDFEDDDDEEYYDEDYDDDDEPALRPRGHKGQLALTFLLLAGIAAVAIYWVAVLL